MKILKNISKIIFPNFKCLNCGKECFSAFCPACKRLLPINNKIKIKNNNLIFSPFFYDGIIKKLILDFKYNNKKYLFSPLAKIMADYFKLQKIDINFITFIPMHDKKLKQRGYNQAEILASEIGLNLNIPVLDCLKKDIPTPSQTELSFLERRENIKNSILPKSVNIQNSNILLIDDVYTTGATTEEASKVLYKMGASKVVVLTLACTRSDESLN